MFSITIPMLILFSLTISCGIFSALVLSQEIGAVNRKLPEDEQIPYFGAYPGRTARIRREYRRLYPSGKLERLCLGLQVAAFAGFAALVVLVLRSTWQGR